MGLRDVVLDTYESLEALVKEEKINKYKITDAIEINGQYFIDITYEVKAPIKSITINIDNKT